MNLQEVKARVRALIDDPDGTYATDSFVEPLINQTYEECYNRMVATGAEFERKAVELSNVAAQTKDLSAYILPTKELEMMIQPTLFEWKLTGTEPINYRQAALTDRVSDVIAGQNVVNWEFRSGVIYFTPSTLAMDIRIRGDFLFSPLSSDTDAIAPMKNLGFVIAYGTCELIGIARGNPAWVTTYKVKKDDSLDDLMQYLTRKDQAKIRRVGRMSRRRSRRPMIPAR